MDPVQHHADRPTGRDAVRLAVLEAAAERFAAEGPDASLRQIAADAGVNLGLIHRHVGNKDDLLRAVLAYEVERGVGTIERAGDAGTALREIFAASAADGRYIRIIAWLLLRDPTRVQHQDRYPGMTALRALLASASTLEDPEQGDAQLMTAMAAIYGWTVFGPQLRASFGTDDTTRWAVEQRIARIVAAIIEPG